MLPDDFPDDCKPEPRSFGSAGPEGLENVLGVGSINAGPGIGDDQLSKAQLFIESSDEVNLAAGRHRIKAVVNEVHKNLLQHLAVGHYPRQIIIQQEPVLYAALV